MGKEPELVCHPKHYGNGPDDPYEAITVLKHKLSREEYRGFLKGNVLKYIMREGKKGDTFDIKKAAWYALRLVEEFGDEDA